MIGFQTANQLAAFRDVTRSRNDNFVQVKTKVCQCCKTPRSLFQFKNKDGVGPCRKCRGLR